MLTEPGKRLIDKTLSRHVASEERLLLSLSEAEQPPHGRGGPLPRREWVGF